MRSHQLFAVLCSLGMTFTIEAGAADVTQLPQTDPMTWLVKTVCADAQNRLVTVDPYGGCPVGTTIRKLKSGDPLPYHNVEQIGYQQRDAFPVSNPTTGKTWVVNTYDYVAYIDNVVGAAGTFNTYNLYATKSAETDGFDVIGLQQDNIIGKWVTINNTGDGGGYGQAFYGPNCTLGDGWLLFPSQNFLSGGQAQLPIADVYWEQGDQSYPGKCSFTTKFSTPLTSWQLTKGFKFGGVNGNSVKTMDTLISFHGFKSVTSTSSLEVFYFTREYGMTRWEVWTPTFKVPTPKRTTECDTPATQLYHNVSYIVEACHDWSRVNDPLPSSGQIPIWPIPNTNLLSDPHFIKNSNSSITPPWTVPATLSAVPMVSTKPNDWDTNPNTAGKPWRDALFAQPGVGYLSLSCVSNCTGAVISQEIPRSQFVASANYGFAVSARTHATTQCPAPCNGTIAVGLQQLDASGNVIETASTPAQIASDNGAFDPGTGESYSVYLSSAFISGNTTIKPNAARVIFFIAPQTAQTFDLLNAWLSPWPTPAPLSGQTQAAISPQVVNSAIPATTGHPTFEGPQRTDPPTVSTVVVHPSELQIDN